MNMPAFYFQPFRRRWTKIYRNCGGAHDHFVLNKRVTNGLNSGQNLFTYKRLIWSLKQYDNFFPGRNTQFFPRANVRNAIFFQARTTGKTEQSFDLSCFGSVSFYMHSFHQKLASWFDLTKNSVAFCILLFHITSIYVYPPLPPLVLLDQNIAV